MIQKKGNILLPLLVAVAFLALVVGGYHFWKQSTASIRQLTWDECLKTPGATTLMSYPGQCITPDGIKVVQPVTLTPAPVEQIVNWAVYNRTDYQIKAPPNWMPVYASSMELNKSPNQVLSAFDAPDGSRFVINKTPSQGLTVNQYLKRMDTTSQTAWEGQPSKKILSTNTISVNSLSGVQRREEWLAAGFTTTATYLLAGQNIFEFHTIPGRSNTEASEAFQKYPLVLATFKYLGLPVVSPTPQPTIVLQGGIEGVMTIWPNAPRCQTGTSCSNPYQGTVVVKTADGSTTITQFSADSKGNFKVNLPTGQYQLTGLNTGLPPLLMPQKVTVENGKYTEVSLQFDSGMR